MKERITIQLKPIEISKTGRQLVEEASVSDECGEAREIKGGTQKQRNFCRHLVSGLSLSEAYRRSYDAQNMKPATIHKEAHKLMKNPRVTTMYESIVARADCRIINQRIADRTEILETLTSLMRGQLSADANRVRATQLLSQAQGLLREPLEAPGEERSPEEIRKELIDRLRSLGILGTGTRDSGESGCHNPVTTAGKNGF